MKKRKKRIIRIIAYLMIIVLFAGGISWILPDQTVEPENPLVAEAADLNIDIRMDSGASEDSQAENQAEGGEASKKEQTDQRPKEHQEKMTEEETTETPEQPETTTEETSKETTDSSEETSGENGETDKDSSENNESGETPSDNGEESTEHPGTGEEPGEDEHGLVTDLSSRIVLFSEINNDTLGFYAYYSDRSVNADVKVNYKHATDSGNGTWLRGSGDDYSAKLRLGTNYITIYFTDGKGTRNYSRFTITYQADRADAQHPERGAHPPIIHTNLDDWTGDFETNHFKFTVDAKTWENKRIYSDCIEVRLNGALVTNPTGSGIYEYDLYFSKPVSGNYSDYIVSVLAWDKDGNSKYVEYNVRYLAKGKGETLAPVTVTIDATTVNCGIVDSALVEVVGGDTAADAVLRMLENSGFTTIPAGVTVGSGFYLRGISRAYAFAGCSIEGRLKETLERDGIALRTPGNQDTLKEFDFTEGSGWMYFINGSLCPGVGMGEWPLQGGESITLRFTLAYGKDFGGESYGHGLLSGYCAKWLNGQVIDLGHQYTETDRVEPTSGEEGYVEYTCMTCYATKTEILPATGEPEPPTEPEVPVEPEPPTEPEVPVEPEPPTEPEVPVEPEPPTEPEVPVEPEPPTEPEIPTDPNPPTEPGTPTE